MNKVESGQSILEHVVHLYENDCKPTLTTRKQEIINQIKAILDLKCTEYNLEYSNSVYSGKYYSIIGRVKSKESLSEKFIRKSQILDIINDNDIGSIDAIYSKKANLITYFEKYEDIIGIKILTEVKQDCINVFELLKNNLSDLRQNGILFTDFSDEKQPKTMKNGLKIYNIKGVYQEKFGFELQIKSKIESAWADMDHEIFYKNYQFTPLKSSIQNTMNRIGNLLHEIDGLLYSVRHAENNYELNEKSISFIKDICELYKEPLKNFLNVPHFYDFSKINEILFETYSRINEISPFNELISTNALKSDFLQFDFQGSNKVLENFIKLKERNYDLQSFEYIVLNWMKTLNEYKDDKETYNLCLEKVIVQHYTEFLLMAIDVEQTDEDFKEILYQVMSHSNNASVFLNSDKYKILQWYNKLIVDLKNEDIAEEEDDDFKEELRGKYNCLSIVMGLYLFDGNFNNYQRQIIDVIEEPIFVNDCFDKMKNFIEKMMKTNYERYKRLEPFIRINEEILKHVNVIVN